MRYLRTEKLKQNVCPGHFLSTVCTVLLERRQQLPSLPPPFLVHKSFLPTPSSTRGRKEKRERKEDTREREKEKKGWREKEKKCDRSAFRKSWSRSWGIWQKFGELLDSLRVNVPPLLLLRNEKWRIRRQVGGKFLSFPFSPFVPASISSKKFFLERTDKKAEDLESVLSVTSVWGHFWWKG